MLWFIFQGVKFWHIITIYHQMWTHEKCNTEISVSYLERQYFEILLFKRKELLGFIPFPCQRESLTLENPLDSKEIKPVNPKENQPWILPGRTDIETEAPILWPPDVKSWLMGKDPDAGKDWRQEEKRVTEDEMVGWHHRLNGHEVEQTPGDIKERDMT